MGWAAIRLRDVLEQIQRPTPVEADKEYRLLGMHSRVEALFCARQRREAKFP